MNDDIPPFRINLMVSFDCEGFCAGDGETHEDAKNAIRRELINDIESMGTTYDVKPVVWDWSFEVVT